MKASDVDVNGSRTRYLEAGKGEPLLLGHGGEFSRYPGRASYRDLNVDGLAEFLNDFGGDRTGCGWRD